jgi:hypothetical protein
VFHLAKQITILLTNGIYVGIRQIQRLSFSFRERCVDGRRIAIAAKPNADVIELKATEYGIRENRLSHARKIKRYIARQRIPVVNKARDNS